MQSQLEHVDSMCRDPNVRLLKARFESDLQLTHGFPVRWAVLNVDTHSDELIVVQGALIQPTTSHYHGISTGRPELSNQFVIGLDEFLFLDGPTVVIEQRE
jgi:hypothetical protein